MQTQKTLYIPTINGVPVENKQLTNPGHDPGDPALLFSTDPIEFAYSIPFSIHFLDLNGEVTTDLAYYVLGSNTTNINDAVIQAGISIAAEPKNRVFDFEYTGFKYLFLNVYSSSATAMVTTILISK
jgi:hypothetical protein